MEGAGCTITSDRDVLADDLALLPFVIARKDLGDGKVWRTLLLVRVLCGNKSYLAHDGKI